MRYLSVLLLVLLTSFQINAQAYKEQFGKNRIQYKDFNWKYYQSENYEVYYYQGGETLAKQTIEYLEDQFGRMTETISYQPHMGRDGLAPTLCWPWRLIKFRYVSG